MSDYQISSDDLTAGKTVVVRGIVTWCTFLHPADTDEKIKAANARRAAVNVKPVNYPHVEFNIRDCEVVYADSANPTLEERYVAERMKPSRKDPNGPVYFSRTLGSLRLPTFTKMNDQGEAEVFMPTDDLAAGQEVIVVYNTFNSPANRTRGLGISNIHIPNTVVLYRSNSNAAQAAQALAALGINIDPTAIAHAQLELQHSVAPEQPQAASDRVMPTVPTFDPSAAPGQPAPVQAPQQVAQQPQMAPQQVQQGSFINELPQQPQVAPQPQTMPQQAPQGAQLPQVQLPAGVSMEDLLAAMAAQNAQTGLPATQTSAFSAPQQAQAPQAPQMPATPAPAPSPWNTGGIDTSSLF